MKLGVFSMPCHPPHRKHVETFAEDLRAITLADELGYDEFWLGEHFTIPQDGTYRRVTHENVMAILEIWASDGQEGFTWRSTHPQFNFTVPHREEWRGIGLHMKPYQRPHPPIAVAGLSRSSTTLRWAGEHGWIPMSIHIISAQDLVGHWAAYEEGARGHGHTPRRSEWRIARDIYVADTDEQAEREVMESSMAYAYQHYFFPLVASFGQMGLWKDRPELRDDEVTLELLRKTRWIVGSPDSVAQQLRDLSEAVGGFGGVLMLHYDWEGENGPRWRHSMELLATKVMPQLRDLTGEPALTPAG